MSVLHLVWDVLAEAKARGLLVGAFLYVLLKAFSPNRRSKFYITQHDRIATKVGESDSKKVPEYDFIIVGGGTSGCALAARLTEQPGVSVLLLEAGTSGVALPFSRSPATYSMLYHNKNAVNNFWTEAQEFAKGRIKFWPRAKLLGGCTSINAQMAQYGAPSDFDEWANIIGDDSWSYKKLRPFFRKFEKYTPRPDFPDVDPSDHGTKGPVQIGYFNEVTFWCKSFVDACVNSGIPANPDFNGHSGTIGVGRVMTYVSDKKVRVSAESAYLTPEVLSRPNLTVATEAHATKLIFHSKISNRVVGVEFGKTRDAPRFEVRCRKEVIVCGGAVQSPQILMLSGIGPADHLQEHGISVVVDNPAVGDHLVDHPIVDTYLKIKAKESVVGFLANPNDPKNVAKLLWHGIKYYLLGTGGAFAMNWADAAAFFRSDDSRLFPREFFPEAFTDASSGKDAPDLEIISTPVAYKPHGEGEIDVPSYGLHVYLLRPLSRGKISLSSKDPFGHPKMDPKYLSHPHDLKKLVRGLRVLSKITHVEPIASNLDHTFTRPDFDHQLASKADAELEEIVRTRVQTVYHPTSTCRMAKREDGGVVDAKLRVYGVEGLRVCDASVFPEIVSGHTAGACYAVAEKLAHDIKSDLASGLL